MPRRTYKKIDFSKPHRGRRRKWKDMEILRIKLNPEQAVITCCSTARGRDLIYGTVQCNGTEADCGPGYEHLSS